MSFVVACSLDRGRPGIETRFVIGLLLLKPIYGLSDEGICEHRVHDPYFLTSESFAERRGTQKQSNHGHFRDQAAGKCVEGCKRCGPLALRKIV